MASLEICVGDAAGIDAAIVGGADRIELCSALEQGGLTPSIGLIRHAVARGIPTFVLLRPRPGDFIHDAAEAAILCDDIDAAVTAGATGLVIGAALPDGRLDAPLLERLVRHAAEAGDRIGRRIALTLHRVIDLCPDQHAALDIAIALGFDRVLTSGGAPTALEGRTALAALHAHAAGRILILAGSGVDAAAAPALLASGADELHASARRTASQDPRLVAMGFAAATRRVTDAEAVVALRTAIRTVEDGRKKGLSNTNA